MRQPIFLAVVIALALGAALGLDAQSGKDWALNGGPNNIRYSTLTQITPANVAKLEVAWSYDSHDAFKDSEMQSNPIVVDGVLYATTPSMHVVALNAATGAELWSFDGNEGRPQGRRVRNRGVTLHEDRVFFTHRNFLWALDKRSGKPIAAFGEGGRIDLRQGLDWPPERSSITASTPGVIFEDTIIMGSTVPETLPGTPGHIRAFDVHTGKQRWIFHTIPHPGEFGYETWPKEAYKVSGGANAWAGLTVDPKLAIVFAATGSASFDFYGSNRIGADLFANCVLALDARTGKRVWHFQGIQHDVWDYDFPSPPSLVTVTRSGQKVDAVAQTTKYGYVYVLDRRTGKPLFPVEYRKTPASPLDGEMLSETQPYPVKPPPYVRQKVTEDMLTKRTPEAHDAVLATFRSLDAGGMFTPPGKRGTLIFPGVDGGAEWGGSAFDPDSGLLYVNANEMPWIIRMVTHDTQSLYQNNCASCHGKDLKGSPPTFPSLVDIGQRRTRQEIASVIREGTGRMPGFDHLNVNEIVNFLLTGKDPGADVQMKAGEGSDPNLLKYRNEGYHLWRDPQGYPPITPPWGTLNAIDLNRGEIRWKIPLGEFPELAAKGMKDTGSDNYGGPVVTSNGLLFIAATNFDKKIRAFDKSNGKLLWESMLPAAGNATPSIYEVNGREYVVIVCGGGKNGAPSGSSIVAFALPEPRATSSWVDYDANHRLRYRADDRGNHIMDFSHAGYGGGGVRIPDAPVVASLTALPGDNTAQIQAAIDRVSQHPLDASGMRGAVLLQPGTYELSGTLNIAFSGVVLRGAGPLEGGTTIKLTGAPHRFLAIRGSGKQQGQGAPTPITDSYVPSAAGSFHVRDASSFRAGDAVLIRKPVTATWVHAMGMDTLVRDGKAQTWIKAGSYIQTDRVVRKVEGNQILLDVPLSDALDARFLEPEGASLVHYTFPGRISNVGVEHLRVVAPAQDVAITESQYSLLNMDAVIDAWAQDIAVVETQNAVTIGSTAKRVTLDSIHLNHPTPHSGAAAPADFSLSGTQILVNRCSVRGDGTWPLVTQAEVTGPNVVLHMETNERGVSPHQRWATGLLVDSSTFTNSTARQPGIAFSNRKTMGSGHGWDIGWGVAWNVTSPFFLVEQPPGAMNWCIGCVGATVETSDSQGKMLDSPGKSVAPASLYLAQLRQRLGDAAVANVGY